MGEYEIKKLEQDLETVERAEISLEESSKLHKELLEELQGLV